MSAEIFSLESARSANIGIVEDARKGGQAVHDVVVAYQANRRSGTACTKTRGEVAGSNKKLWKQKGTGRARMGERTSPIWTGGGVVFGPRPRSYAKAVNKTTKRLAFRKALSERIAAGDVLLAETFEVADGKTKSFSSAVKAMTDSGNILIVAGSFSDKTYLAGRNYKPALLMTAEELNTEHLLRFNKIILVSDSLQTLSGRTTS
ncbi:MAG: 50S ribosomal protein L4 [Verrucomicrobiales bacterium]|nr:50S ribosomal protein L4 [Verrucomicrobiales bacterium]